MQVALSHDLFRQGGPAGDAEVNSAWLWPLLRPVLAELGCRTVLHSRHDPATAEAVSAALSGLDAQAAWPRLYSDAGLAGAVRSTCRPLLDADLVIGHELSPNQVRVLHAAGTPVLDLSIDAVRFGTDLFLRARSTDPALSRLIQQAHVPDSGLAAQAAALRTRFGPHPSYVDSALLFAGQTDADASLIEGAQLQSAQPHLDRIRALLAPGRRLLLKPHPYARTNADILLLHQAIPGSLVITDNIYALLGAPGLHAVATLSSSVATEARLFGKPATTLLTPDRDTVSPPMAEGRVTLGALQDILRQRCGQPRRAVPVRLRPAMKQAWGYAPDTQAGGHTLMPGATVSFGAPGHGASLCTLGWSTPEQAGRWTDGPLALLLVQPLVPGLALELDLIPFVPPRAQPLRLTVRGGADQPVQATFTAGKLHRLVVPLPRTPGPVQLRFELAGASSPAAHRLSEDRRTLGVRLLRARLSSPEPAPVRPRQRISHGIHVLANMALMLLNLVLPAA